MATKTKNKKQGGCGMRNKGHKTNEDKKKVKARVLRKLVEGKKLTAVEQKVYNSMTRPLGKKVQKKVYVFSNKGIKVTG